MKAIIKRCIPPVLIDLARSALGQAPAPIEFSGDYPTWEKAAADSEGYDAPDILSKTRDAIAQVRDGKAVFERDSVLLPERELPFPLLASLLRIALEDAGRLHVLDFGGSLGSTYFQCRDFLSAADLRWRVVEQPAHVACGTAEFADGRLEFFPDIAAALAARRSNVLLLSSVLQYLPEPHAFLDQALASRFRHVVIDRTAFHRSDRDRITVQRVPEWIYPASYPARFFSEERFLAHFKPAYDLVADFPTLDRPVLADGLAYSKGFLFRLRG